MIINADNKGRLINYINGITGVSAGGRAIINLPTNQRYHRNILRCTAVNYTAPVVAIPAGAGAGDGNAVLTATVVNRVITAIVITTAGATYTNGTFDLVVTDPTGAGFAGTATVSGGAFTSTTVTSGGTATAIDPTEMITSLKQLVNGVNMRDISTAEIMKTVGASGYHSSRGELPLYYTPPWRNVNPNNEITSWDLYGQSTFAIQVQIASDVVSPGLEGISEFDYQRNTRPSPADPSVLEPFLQPTAQHSFGFNIVAGRNSINTLPFSFPISRMWIVADTADSIYQLDVEQDGNKVFEATSEEMKDAYGEYGFTFGKPDFVNTDYASSAALQSAYNPPIYFDAAYIADPDQRWWKALKCVNSLVVRPYSTVAQSITVVMETLPGSYS